MYGGRVLVVRIFLGDGLTLVVELLALCQRKFKLDTPVLKQGERNECVAFTLLQAAEFADLLLMQQKLPGAQRDGSKMLPCS